MRSTIHHRYADVDGHRIFYREAGPRDAPTLLLLHGFPSSSSMFRGLLPLLADRWHLLAPDHLGFGHSDAPAAGDFGYSFDALSSLTAGLLEQLGVTRYAMYVHDYGAPIGWRLALHDPSAISAIISQSGNAYQIGLQQEFFAAGSRLLGEDVGGHRARRPSSSHRGSDALAVHRGRRRRDADRSVDLGVGSRPAVSAGQ